MKVLCTICAREGSKGLVGKALCLVNGKPLIGHTIEQALKSKIFDNIVVSTDSEKIAEESKNFGLKPWFIRPKKLAVDSASKLDVIRHAITEAENYYEKNFDIIIDLDITSPLRKVDDIQKALKYFLDTKSNNLISACRSKKNPYFNMIEVINRKVQVIKKTDKQILHRQNAPKTYEMNAAIYIWKREVILNSDDLFTEKTCLYEMKETQSIDIDTQNDLDIVQFLLKKKNDD